MFQRLPRCHLQWIIGSPDIFIEKKKCFIEENTFLGKILVVSLCTTENDNICLKMSFIFHKLSWPPALHFKRGGYVYL